MQGTSPDEKRARHEEKQAFDAPTLAPTASPADEEDEMLCRYCFEGTEEGELLSPCKCSGGQKWVHLSCLRRWQRMVLISQPTHPMFYTTDQRHYTCNVCASAFTCAPPTRHELMSSFTGPELGAMMEEGCIIGAHDNFSRELATALDGMPDEMAEVASYQHWTGGVYLITKVTPVDPVANFEIPSANVLSRFNNELGDEGRLTDVRGTVLQLLPVGPLAAAMEAAAPVVAAGEAAMANEAAVASQGADVCAMAVEVSGSGGDGAGVTAGWRARQEMRRIEEGVRSGRLPGLFPLTLTFAKVPPPDCGEDHLTAVNLARPVPHPTPRMLRQVDAAVRRLREALPHVDETRIRVRYSGGGRGMGGEGAGPTLRLRPNRSRGCDAGFLVQGFLVRGFLCGVFLCGFSFGVPGGLEQDALCFLGGKKRSARPCLGCRQGQAHLRLFPACRARTCAEETQRRSGPHSSSYGFPPPPVQQRQPLPGTQRRRPPFLH